MMSRSEKRSRRFERRKMDIHGTIKQKVLSKKISCYKKQIYDLSTYRKSQFYASEEWKTLKSWLFKRCFYQCVCCRNNKNLHVDHIYPISNHPQYALDFKNIQYLCSSCNMLKSNYTNKRFTAYTKGGHKNAFSPSKEEIEEIKNKWKKYFPVISKEDVDKNIDDIAKSNFFA